MTTIKDVVRVAGVSFKTVSRVINNDPSVRDETRQRVLAAVRQLEYRPNVSARQMRTQKSGVIGVITDHIATTPFAGNIIKGAQEAAWNDNKMLLIVNTDGQPYIEAFAVDMMLERQVEGIIIATMYHRAVVLPPNLRPVPTVLLNCYVPDYSIAAAVPDEVQGGCTATEYLIQQGHTRIGFINNIDPIPAAHGRLHGYRQALQAAQILYEPALVPMLKR
ncbi:MAG: LacI family DNA-binding transcriptional regulator [Chloroflexaceae bacterium]|nr:LacI family DNA-binding transcriptional regulator [Chloroflexaceae bacterium]